MKILLQYAITNHMSKLAHLYHPIVWYKCKSLRMWYISYCNKIFMFAVLERWLTHFNETQCSLVYLIFEVLLHNLILVLPFCTVIINAFTSHSVVPWKKKKNNGSQDTISDCKKLKNWSSDTDIRAMLDVVCGNIQCTVRHESTGSAGASVTTSSTGMSSSINKELFQRVDIEVSRRSVVVTEMDDINDISVIYQS